MIIVYIQTHTDALERHVGQLTCYVIACCVCVTDRQVGMWNWLHVVGLLHVDCCQVVHDLFSAVHIIPRDLLTVCCQQPLCLVS